MTLLRHYWRDDDPAELTAAIARDWADVLEGLPQEYIQKAAIRFQQENEKRKPTPAGIYKLARDLMPPPVMVVRSVTQPEPYSAMSVPFEERRKSAADIFAEVGFKHKTFGGQNDE
jgi:hypothetical protein